ncbi:MAG: NfeD family protein [Verrucomicrobiales bacterium]|nr:NfeD family protein [Verrucomicrobiales bacterium]
MNSLDAWHWWMILGIILIICEMYTVSFFLASFGVAALGSALAAALGASVTWQLGVFALASAAVLVLLRPVFARGLYRRSENRPTNVDALAGVAGTVVEDIPAAGLAGRVRIFGEEWRAVSSNGQVLLTGCLVEVVAVDGATLNVRQKASQPQPLPA